MKKQIVIIHGGDAFETQEEYLAYLRSKEVTLEKLRFQDWKSNLPQVLGNEYDILFPKMPNSLNARYAEWKIWFEKIIPLLDEKVVFIGHSLGGIFLAKYLSENKYPKKIKGTFLVAAPYNTADENPYVDFNLTSDLSKFQEQGGDIFIYHSKDDVVVPFSHAESYRKELPKAHTKFFDGRGHFNQSEFPEIVEDIKKL